MKAEARENPRTRRVRRLIIDTAIEVLLERGARDVTASVVAEKADVARTTVYRHWPDQRSLLLATIEALTSAHHLEPSSGPLADDVTRELERLRMRLVKREVRSVFGALAAHAAQDEAFEAAQRHFIRQLGQPMVSVLERAQQSGEVESGVDCTFEATLLVGPILHQHLALAEEVSDTLIGAVTQRWLAAHGL